MKRRWLLVGLGLLLVGLALATCSPRLVSQPALAPLVDHQVQRRAVVDTERLRLSPDEVLPVAPGLELARDPLAVRDLPPDELADFAGRYARSVQQRLEAACAEAPCIACTEAAPFGQVTCTKRWIDPNTGEPRHRAGVPYLAETFAAHPELLPAWDQCRALPDLPRMGCVLHPGEGAVSLEVVLWGRAIHLAGFSAR